MFILRGGKMCKCALFVWSINTDRASAVKVLWLLILSDRTQQKSEYVLVSDSGIWASETECSSEPTLKHTRVLIYDLSQRPICFKVVVALGLYPKEFYSWNIKVTALWGSAIQGMVPIYKEIVTVSKLL